MLQRIQTIYLLITTALGIMACFMPLFSFGDTPNAAGYTLTALGIQQYIPAQEANVFVHYTIGLFAISVLIPLVSFLTIWLFKHRKIQIRMTIFNMLLMIGYYALAAWAIYFVQNSYQVISKNFGIALSLHLINLIVAWLTIRAIGKDEALVRSLDRLR